MKLYGYADAGLPPEEVTPLALAEITLCATPQELRDMSKFLADCADEVVCMGSTYDHVHLSDRIRQFESSPHVVVAPAEGADQ